MRPPELATIDIQSLREVFVVEQRQKSENTAQSAGTIYFNVDIMLQGPEFPKSFLRENVEKFAAEHFFKPTSRLAYFDGKEWFHPDGQSYRGFFDRAMEYHKGSEKLVKRFGAEGDGYDNSGILINSSLDKGIQLPEFVIASPPGDVYRNAAFKTRNVYFLAKPICQRAIQLGDKPEKEYVEYEMLVVPGQETTTETQWNIVAENSDLATSLSMLGLTLEMVNKGDANFVVATPLILRNIEELVNNLGYEGTAGLQSEAEKMLELDKDPLAVQRRTDMIDYFTDKMWGYVSRRHDLTDQERLKLKSLADIMHDYLSAEGGSEYIGQTFEEVERLIEGHTIVHQRNLGVNFTTQEMRYSDWSYAEWAYADYHRRLDLNIVTQERRNNAGCPVSTNQSLFGSEFGGFEDYSSTFGYESATYSGFDTVNGYETNISYSSTGKYTEFYDYKPGVCKHCGKEKPHVAHPKSAEVKCAGWCSDCEQ